MSMRICAKCGKKAPESERFCPTDDSVLVDQVDYDRMGQTVGNYHLQHIIGRGGMGTVFKGEHIYIGKPVAVKVLHERFARYEDAVRRFLREARTASSIQHPNIADVTDFGHLPEGGGVYFVMEYLEGESLEDLIEREAPMTLHRAINIANQSASALAAAHDEGVVHRDLKPENMILTRRPGRRDVVRVESSGDGAPKYVVEKEGTFDFVKIIDFGIAQVRDPKALLAQNATSSMAGAIVGTPEYMSPEAARGDEVDHRSDIYALGVIFFDMLAGRPPFEAQTAVEVLSKHISQPPPSPRQINPSAEVTPAAERLIMKALSKNPSERQQSMDEFRAELNDCFGNTVYRRDVERFPAFAEAGIESGFRPDEHPLDAFLTKNRKGPPPLPADVRPVEQQAPDLASDVIVDPAVSGEMTAEPHPDGPGQGSILDKIRKKR